MPIDICFTKQERCTQILIDGGVEIHDAVMGQTLQVHIGKKGLVSSEYTKWCVKTTADCMWVDGKKHFRKALHKVMMINKPTAAETGLNVNMVKMNSHTKKRATTAKAETIDSMANTIEELIISGAQLTKANKDFVEQIKRLKSDGQNNRRRSNNNSNNNAKDENEIDDDGFNLNNCCWTCGYKIRRGHTSKSCRFRINPGHKKEAMRENPMGGSTFTY